MPAPISDLTATFATGSTRPTFSWTYTPSDYTGGLGWWIEYRADASTYWFPAIDIGSQFHLGVDGSGQQSVSADASAQFQSGVKYWFRIQAKYLADGREYSSWSTPTSATSGTSTSGVLTGVTATPLRGTQMWVSWTPITVSTLQQIRIHFSAASQPGGEGDAGGNAVAPSGSSEVLISHLCPNTTYDVIVTAFFQNMAQSTATTTVTTGPADTSVSTVVSSTLRPPPGSETALIQVGGTLQLWCNKMRPLVYQDRRWYPMGLKPQLNACTLANVGSGALTGVFTAYVVLHRSPRTRSIPGPVSNTVSVTNGLLQITPDKSGSALAVRDSGVDENGTSVTGCDYWEVYLAERSMSVPVRVAMVPAGTTSVTLSASLTLAMLTDGTRRPMELQYESALPPACGRACYREQESRVYAFGETTLKPTSQEVKQGANLSITQGQKYCTVTNWASMSDAIIGKELFLNKAGTGWTVFDVNGNSTSATVYLIHSDPDIYSQGYRGTTNTTVKDFAFNGNPNRVYRSAFFSGEAGGLPSFSPETFPPTNIMESELDPDDNHSPTGVIASRDTMFLFKPNRTFYLDGGAAMDGDVTSFPPVVTAARKSGVISHKTLAIDRFDRCFGLSDKGPAMFTRSGAELIALQSGNSWFFERIFEQATAWKSVGCFYPRDDYYVLAGLDLKGNGGNKDGCIVDLKQGYKVFPFSYPRQITCMVSYLDDDNNYALLIGDATGRQSILFVEGIYVDDYDTAGTVAATSAISPRIDSGVLYPASGRAMTIESFFPKIRQTPLATPTTFTLALNAEPNIDNIETWATTVSRTFTSDASLTNHQIAKVQTQAAQLRLSWTSSKSERVEIHALRAVSLEYGGSGQKQS